MRRIRTRLIAAFVAVALLPAVPTALLVRGLLERSFEPPFAAETADALEAGLEDSRARLQAERARFAADLASGAAPGEGDTVGEAAPAEIRAWARGRPADGEIERVDGWIAAVLPVPEAGGAGAEPRVVARPLPDGLAERAGRMTEAIALLRAFREDRAAVLAAFLVPFLLLYALLVAAAVAVGAWLAGRIARPVEALSAGAARVGAGDLGTRVDVDAGDEVGRLVGEFNRMVESLDAQRAELARLERVAAWRDLARSLAHEIKNPLTPIQLAVQQLGDRYPREGEPGAEYRALLEECVGIVDEEVEALRRLVKEFSEFARLPRPEPEPGDAGALLDEITRLYGERAERVGSGAVPARFDAAELKRALINLVDNGIAACREAGRPERVELAAESEAAGAVVIRVRDAGAGIPGDHRARIFEPDFSTKSGGMGLGLAIVEGIVRGHGGTIEVESREGEGTEFALRLPAAAAAAAANAATNARGEAR